MRRLVADAAGPFHSKKFFNMQMRVRAKMKKLFQVSL
jgi:hypothetical protein